MSDETRTQIPISPPVSGTEPDGATVTVAGPRSNDAVGNDPFTVAQPSRTTPESGSGPRGTVPGYEVMGELGRGAMGVVYKARHAKMNRMVALKMALGGRVGEKDLIRFLAEAQAVASVKHDNVVQVYDYGESGGYPYMALEFCSGGSLADRLKDEDDPIGPKPAARMVARISAGVAAAHEAGIVHRDLKPGNVLLDDDGEPKVADFGLAKRGASELTATQAVMGTPSYMSPEQAGGKTKFVGPQADVWALGVILYEMLVGSRPFPGTTTDEVLAGVLHANPPTVRTIKSSIPRDLDLICRKCLEKNPADRYPSAAELTDDLERFDRGEPISARPLGVVPRTVRWARRNPVVAGLMGVVVLITLGLIGSLYVQYKQALTQAGTERAAKEGAERERLSAVLAQQNAERAEEAERQKAQAELAVARSAVETAQANALVELLGDLFRSSDPMALFFGDAVPALGVGATQEGQAAVLGPFLRNAAARFRASLTDPAVAPVRAKLLAGVGNGMKSIGMFAEAKPVLEEALALRRAHLPETHPDVWQSELDLGRLEAEGGDFLAGIERFRKVHALQKKSGADAATLLTTRFYEGVALSTVGLPEAGSVLKEVAEEREKLLGKTHKDTLLAKIGVIAWFLEKGKWVEVMNLFGEFREDMRNLPDVRIRETFGPVLDAQAKLALAHVAKEPGSLLGSQLKKTVDGFQDDINRLEKLIPEDHLVLCIYRFELAVLRLHMGEGPVADALFARVLVDARKTTGLSHPKALLLLEAYSKRMAATGKLADARKLYDEVEKSNRDRFGPENPWLTTILLKRAKFEQKQGDSARALVAAKAAVELIKREKFLPTVGGLSELFETAKTLGWATGQPQLQAAGRELFVALRPLVVKVYGVKSEEMISLLTAEGKQWYEDSKPAEAHKRFDEALALLPEVPKIDAEERVIVHYWCGRIALDSGRFAEAEKHFRIAITSAKDVSGYSQKDRREDAEYLAKALVAQGKFTDAVPAFEDVRRLYSAKATDVNLSWADMEIATAQLAAGDRAAYAKALEKMFKQYGKSPDASVLSRLAWTAGLGGKTEGWDPVAFEAQYAASFKPTTNYPWGWRGLALVRVRSGKLTEVEAALTKAAPPKAGVVTPLHPHDQLIRGLAAVARKDFARARLHLADAERLLEAQKPTEKEPYKLGARSWFEYTDAMILLAELRASILAPPPRAVKR